MFTKYDGGRASSRRPKQCNDCVVRAIAIALNMPYDVAYDTMTALGRGCSRGTAKDAWQPWLSERATKHSFPAEKGQPRMNLGDFVKIYNQGSWVVQMAKHLVAVVEGVVFDDSEPDYARCVYAAWKS